MSVCGRLLPPSNATAALAVWCVSREVIRCFASWPSRWGVALRFYSPLLFLFSNSLRFSTLLVAWSELSVKKIIKKESWQLCKNKIQQNRFDSAAGTWTYDYVKSVHRIFKNVLKCIHIQCRPILVRYKVYRKKTNSFDVKLFVIFEIFFGVTWGIFSSPTWRHFQQICQMMDQRWI